VAPNPNIQWHPTTQSRQRPGGPEPQYQWPSEERILICTALIDGGASRWFYVVALVCIWNALKFIVIGPVSVALLVWQRRFEQRLDRQRQASLPAQINA